MSQSQYTYYIIILKGGWGGQGDDYLDYAGGGGPEMGKSWLRNMCTLPKVLNMWGSNWQFGSKNNLEGYYD